MVTASSRKAYLARLHSLQQLLFEARVVDEPPVRGPAAASIDQRLAVIEADCMFNLDDARGPIPPSSPKLPSISS